jgi:Transition state regulatory protein AbrB
MVIATMQMRVRERALSPTRVTRYEHGASPTLNPAETVTFCPGSRSVTMAPAGELPGNIPQAPQWPSRRADFGSVDGYLATTPGGVNVILGVVTSDNADTTFVTAAQVLRIIAILIVVPTRCPAVPRPTPGLSGP